MIADPTDAPTGAPTGDRPTPPVAWRTSDGLTPYPDAVAAMAARVAAIRAGTADEEVWLVEHPPLYTAGTSARPAELTDPTRFPSYAAGRGGQWTYHGPGQRVAYVMLDLTHPHGTVPPRDVHSTCTGWRNGCSARSPATTYKPSAATAASASGWPTPHGGPKQKSVPSAFGSAAG